MLPVSDCPKSDNHSERELELTARQHLERSASRAFGRFYEGKDKAIACFLAEVSKHPGTAWIRSDDSTRLILTLGYGEGPGGFLRAMTGFAVDN